MKVHSSGFERSLKKLSEIGDFLDGIIDFGLLCKGASQFHKNAMKVKKKMWWEHTKAKLGIGGVVTLVILIVIIIIVVKTQGG